MKKLIFMLAALSFSAVLWGQAISDQSFLDGRRTLIGEPLGTFAQQSGQVSASTTSAPVGGQNQNVAGHLNALPQAEEREIDFEDTSSAGILKRLQFLEYLHGLAAGTGSGPAPTQGFIPQQVEGQQDQVIIIGYRGNQKNNLVIPIRIDEKIVKGVVVGIGPGALANLGLTGEITFEDGSEIAYIDAEAFANNEIAKVTIPDVVTDIKNGAFSNNKLTEIRIPETLTTLSESVFANNQLTNIKIPESITVINHHAFSNNKLTSLTIPRNVTQIDNSAFENNQIARLDLPVSIAQIGDNAFAVNKLQTLDLSKLVNMTELTYGVFSHNLLAKVTLSPTTDRIGPNAFSNNKLPTVTIPKAVTIIDKGAFSVNVLKEVLFEGDTGRQAITAQGQTEGANVSIIGDGAFAYNDLPAIAIPNSVLTVGNNAFYDNQLTRVVIGEYVTTIGNEAFFGNKLRTVTIPNKVEVIGTRAFAGTNPGPTRNNKNTLTSVTLGEGVQKIGPQAFANNQLKQLAIPNQVTEIHDAAFDTNEIAELVLGNKVRHIGKSAFNKNQLKSLVIPESCEFLLEGAFTNNQLPKGNEGRVIIPQRTNAYPFGAGNKQPSTDAVRKADTQKAFDAQTNLLYL
jgi:hypothetical protein